MAIIIKTKTPKGLLNSIKKAIDDKVVVTWIYNKDGDFIHSKAQYKDEALLRPKTYAGELRFGILKQKGKTVTRPIYGIYHGRFIEMLLTHFYKSFTIATPTTQKTEPDSF
jgi:hypothetical protein